MGRDFFETDPEARDLFDAASERCGRDLERDRVRGSRGGAAGEPRGAGVRLPRLDPRLPGARSDGFPPPATAGYSLGNYAALVAAGAISFEDGLDVLVAVWRETEALGIRGAMAAVIGCRRDAAENGVRRVAGRRTAGLDRQRQRRDPVRSDRALRGRSGRPRNPRPALALRAAPSDELADPQRADAARGPARPARRRGLPFDPRSRRPVLRPGRAHPPDGRRGPRASRDRVHPSDSLERDVRSDGLGRVPGLSRGGAGRDALEDVPLDRSDGEMPPRRIDRGDLARRPVYCGARRLRKASGPPDDGTRRTGRRRRS